MTFTLARVSHGSTATEVGRRRVVVWGACHCAMTWTDPYRFQLVLNLNQGKTPPRHYELTSVLAPVAERFVHADVGVQPHLDQECKRTQIL